MLDHAEITRLIPHTGNMSLLHQVIDWSENDIHCTATSHTLADNPLRTASGLLTTCAIEYAAQAMAVHSALCTQSGSLPSPGFLASARNVQLLTPRLDTIKGLLNIHATKIASDGQQALYRFTLQDDRHTLLAQGRAAVVLAASVSTS